MSFHGEKNDTWRLSLVARARRYWQSPHKLLAPYVHEGMTVLGPGPGMGYFTLELARRFFGEGGCG